MLKTHYDNLQVTRTASLEVIRAAYRQLAQKWHPDRNPGSRDEAERVLKIINRAYEILSDPTLRQEHDEWIENQERLGAGATFEPKPAEDFETGPVNEAKQEDPIRLWNPSAAANWSLLFSPIFGAWLHAKNWSALGEPDKARHSMRWVYACAVIVLVAIFLPEKVSRALGLPLLLAWYFSSGKSQIKEVKNRFGKVYLRKGWAKPLGIGFVSFFAFIFGLASLFTALSPQFQKEMVVEEISRVWTVSNDEVLVTFNLTAEGGTVVIGEESFPVVVDRFDSENKVLTIRFKDQPPTIWLVRQVFDSAGSFTLNVTINNQSQFDLWYVREL